VVEGSSRLDVYLTTEVPSDSGVRVMVFSEGTTEVRMSTEVQRESLAIHNLWLFEIHYAKMEDPLALEPFDP
jgi:hypothetical protein